MSSILKLNELLNSAEKKGYGDKTKVTKPWEFKNEKDKTGSITTSKKRLESNDDSSIIYEVDPNDIIRWSEKDRPENELGNIEELAESLKAIGQQVPCIVRPYKDTDKYELIVGECRWRASQIAKIKLKVIIHDLDDRTAALVQAVENEQRNDLSDYAKGMSYAKKIESGLLVQKDLTDILKISKQQVTKLLSFNKIPENINIAINDYRKVSARTAYEISRLANKGQEYQNILIENADKIREGKIGASTIIKLVEKGLSKNKYSSKKYFSTSGEHIFTIRNENNRKSIYFSKKISDKLDENQLSEFIEAIMKKSV
ncbi:ParB/RepB/Spo0J family partition protein [Francisella sp. 19X1-34]|uniref:ParB/RepB/Spo0J family partition protein n=1 Tax=Francisella sp. 19X1-34 TaxID=3087177 RepID=UPI002E31FDA7|nr:ParB/RepB/Spo0J family partition protein [Francisella sp. 19X1-34]MED7789621.1 ParB/RepB/Spo0J family partition protein [Francisella sp. 19X1-34]